MKQFEYSLHFNCLNINFISFDLIVFISFQRTDFIFIEWYAANAKQSFSTLHMVWAKLKKRNSLLFYSIFLFVLSFFSFFLSFFLSFDFTNILRQPRLPKSAFQSSGHFTLKWITGGGLLLLTVKNFENKNLGEFILERQVKFAVLQLGKTSHFRVTFIKTNKAH